MYTFYNNFTAGEVSKRIYPRIDLVQRKNGCVRLENALPTVQGGVIRRPGTRFVCKAKYADKITRLIPFRYSVDQTYTIEFGHLYMRFITNGGRLEHTPQTITGVDVGPGGTIRITVVGHGYSNGDPLAIRGVLGAVEANGDWVATNVTADTFDLVDSDFNLPWTSGGTVAEIVELAHPYEETDLDEVNYTHDSDLLYFVHPDVEPSVLTRTSATTFTFAGLDLIGGPFNDLNLDATHTMTPSATTGAITVTASAAYFTADMVGHLMRIGSGVGTPAVQGYVSITGYTDPTVVNATVIQTLSGTAATIQWALSAFGPATGYPKVVTWFDQRLIFLGTDTQPYSGWASSTARQLDFSVGTTASDAVSFSIRGDEVNDILWAMSSTELLIGTTGGEHKLTGGNNEPLSPTNGIARQQTAYGSSGVRPVKIGDMVLHVQRGGERIRAVAFSFDKDRYISDDLTLFASHLFKGHGIIDMAFQLQPEPILWIVTSDGLLRSSTMLPEHQVIGFAQHPFPNALVKRCLSQPQRAQTDDETYLLLARTINGQAVQYIEVMDDELYVDCGLSTTLGAAASSLSGLAHLEGELVRIHADGAVYVSKTVTANAVTFEETEPDATYIQVGFDSVPTVIPMSPEWELQTGPTYGRSKSFGNVQVFTLDSPYVTLNGTASEARSTTDLMDTAVVGEANGVHRFGTLGNAVQLHIEISQPDPVPFHVVGIYGEAQIGE